MSLCAKDDKGKAPEAAIPPAKAPADFKKSRRLMPCKYLLFINHSFSLSQKMFERKSRTQERT